jgi:tetratricopeptide (TPR) repeat protein
MEQHDFMVAEKLLSRAAMLFSVAGETVERVRALLTLGYMYFLQGELIRAIETTRAGMLDLPGDERYLYLCGRYNLARFLTESGQYREAAAILEADEELHREFPEPWTQLRLGWLRGKIEAGRGDEAAAEEASSLPGPDSSDSGTPMTRPWCLWRIWPPRGGRTGWCEAPRNGTRRPPSRQRRPETSRSSGES